MPIHILPPAVAAKIAAGEVIERPSSVVKELVENALDAGPTQVSVEIEGGGSRLIRVRDNGSGIAAEEVPLAFQRHATSKIARAEDLLLVTTLGFRGEALPSIAAVAEITLLTRPASSLDGYFLHLREGRAVAQGPRGSPAGTQVTVRELFGGFPARRKFLRSPATEAAHCLTTVSHYALARPDVRFSVLLDGRRVLQTPGSGDLREAAAAVLSAGVAEALLEIGPSPPDQHPGNRRGDITVAGLVSPPGVTRASRGSISLFVNGRWVQHRGLTFAVEEAYQGSLMTGRHPVAVVRVSLPSEEVDVNVHPRKLEVRFLQEGDIFTAVQRAVRRTLTTTSIASMAPPATARPSHRDGTVTEAPLLPGALITLNSLPSSPAPGPAMGPPQSSRRIPLLRVLGQLNSTYIIAEGPDGMYLVDQHAAHERVLFEQVLRRLEQQGWEQQGLMDPQAVEVAADELPLLLAHRELLGSYGFALEPFGGRQVLVRALPVGVQVKEMRQILGEIAAGLRSPEGRRDRLATSIACHSAVRAGNALSLEEMQALLRGLEECLAPQTCPHGRPTMVHLSASQLEREFGRRG